MRFELAPGLGGLGAVSQVEEEAMVGLRLALVRDHIDRLLAQERDKLEPFESCLLLGLAQHRLLRCLVVAHRPGRDLDPGLGAQRMHEHE